MTVFMGVIVWLGADPRDTWNPPAGTPVAAYQPFGPVVEISRQHTPKDVVRRIWPLPDRPELFDPVQQRHIDLGRVWRPDGTTAVVGVFDIDQARYVTLSERELERLLKLGGLERVPTPDEIENGRPWTVGWAIVCVIGLALLAFAALNKLILFAVIGGVLATKIARDVTGMGRFVRRFALVSVQRTVGLRSVIGWRWLVERRLWDRLWWIASGAYAIWLLSLLWILEDDLTGRDLAWWEWTAVWGLLSTLAYGAYLALVFLPRWLNRAGH